ncbi:MAG: hypothetical protein H0U57_02870 [Tatlockia sp.]|nr:hypothetical protein [Tatlockia sp.]
MPAQIVALTGITNEMVALAPSFNDIAEELFVLLKDCVLVILDF